MRFVSGCTTVDAGSVPYSTIAKNLTPGPSAARELNCWASQGSLIRLQGCMRYPCRDALQTVAFGTRLDQ